MVVILSIQQWIQQRRNKYESRFLSVCILPPLPVTHTHRANCVNCVQQQQRQRQQQLRQQQQ